MLPPDSPFSAQKAFDCLFAVFPEGNAQIVKAQISLESSKWSI